MSSVLNLRTSRLLNRNKVLPGNTASLHFSWTVFTCHRFANHLPHTIVPQTTRISLLIMAIYHISIPPSIHHKTQDAVHRVPYSPSQVPKPDLLISSVQCGGGRWGSAAPLEFFEKHHHCCRNIWMCKHTLTGSAVVAALSENLSRMVLLHLPPPHCRRLLLMAQ